APGLTIRSVPLLSARMKPGHFFSALLLLASGVARAEDWPQFLGPTRDGAYHGNDLASEWPKEGPRILWHAATGQGFSGPVVAEGKVILFHRIEKNEIVQCFDAASGRSEERRVGKEG